MTPADLEAWRSRMGWSVRETCRQLDLSQDRYRRLATGEVRVPAHIALACAALAYGLPPWRVVR